MTATHSSRTTAFRARKFPKFWRDGSSRQTARASVQGGGVLISREEYTMSVSGSLRFLGQLGEVPRWVARGGRGGGLHAAGAPCTLRIARPDRNEACLRSEFGFAALMF